MTRTGQAAPQPPISVRRATADTPTDAISSSSSWQTIRPALPPFARPPAQLDGRSSPPDPGQPRTAVYLRVTTKEQAQAGGEAEGYSIPAQRESCFKKAAQLQATVAGEYVDGGESARSANRPELQRLLHDLRSGQYTYVIVHKIDRLARNREDDIAINVALRKAGAQLISCTENVDETPSGKLLYGLLAEIAQIYSRNLAAEVLKGLTQKARSGGTPFRAPIGYRNVQNFIDGRDVRTIEVDDERGPLVAWAFETFASGDWTLLRLADALENKGLVSRPTPTRPAKPLTVNSLSHVLHNPYYLGVVPYQGVHYHGKHPALVPPEVWLRVQDLLAMHAHAHERTIKHPHYLKGSIYRAHCNARMGYSRNSGNGGRYEYFMCFGRHGKPGSCPLRYIAVSRVEQGVEDFYGRFQLRPGRAQVLREGIRREVARQMAETETDAERLRKRLTQLGDERHKLLQAHYVGAVPLDLLKAEMDRLTRQTKQAESELQGLTGQLDDVQAQLDQALRLLDNCRQLYLSAPPPIRRQLNQGFFNKLYINDPGQVARADVTTIFEQLLDGSLFDRLAEESAKHWTRPSAVPHTYEKSAHSIPPTDDLSWAGSSKRTLVEVAGIEPASFGTDTGLLRAQPAALFSASPFTQASW